jgi:ABC-type transporter Mla subunit MlaD
MREQLERRRAELTAELEAGREMLAELDAKRQDLQQTMLRISGALQVLTELLDGDAPADPPAASNGLADREIPSPEPALASH